MSEEGITLSDKQKQVLVDAYKFLLSSNEKAEREYQAALQEYQAELTRHEKQFFREVKRAGIDPKCINPIWRKPAPRNGEEA